MLNLLEMLHKGLEEYVIFFLRLFFIYSYVIIVIFIYLRELSKLMVFSNNSNITDIERWYILLNSVRVMCNIITIIIVSISLDLITLNKICRTIPMILVGNTYLAELIWECTCLSMTLFALENDIQRIQYQDPDSCT